MSNHFSGTGNVGTAPTLRTVQVNGEDRLVADMRIYFDRSVPREDGSYSDEGGFWLSVNIWGSRAETVAKIVHKGARVHVAGSLREDTWEDDEAQQHSAMQLTATRISIDPICIESIEYRPKSDEGSEQKESVDGTKM